jgi:hypothetical protein
MIIARHINNVDVDKEECSIGESEMQQHEAEHRECQASGGGGKDTNTITRWTLEMRQVIFTVDD